MAAALVLRRFSLSFRKGLRIAWILKDVDLDLPAGGLYLLQGPSGAGKSTLIDLLAGELDPCDSTWVRRGRAALETPGRSRPRVAALFQQDGLWDDLSVVENVRRSARGDRAAAAALLAQVGLPDPPERVSLLSGGQRKRVALARALAHAPDLLLLDEPTAGLDPAAAEQVFAALRALHEAHRGRVTLILSTHDVERARPLADGELSLPGDGPLRLGTALSAAPAGPRPESRGGLALALAGPFLALARLAGSLAATAAALLPTEPLRCLGQGLGRLLALLPFLALSGFLLGALALHFVLRGDPLHGALSSALLSGTGKVLLAILLPLLACLLYAAPAVAATFALAGSMARDRQLAAFRALGRPIGSQLLSPLLWSHLIALPLGAAGAAIAALFGAFAAEHWARSSAFDSFLPRFLDALEGADLAWGVVKCLGSAFLIAWIPWHLSARRGLSPGELAESSLRANVWAAVAILGLHGALLFPQLR